MKVLFLYTELADYTITCLKELKRTGADIRVIHYPVNPEAPFNFNLEQEGYFTSIKSFGTYEAFESACRDYAADKIVCSGWVNKWYVRFCSRNRKQILNVLALDNHWSGSLKQQLFRVVAPFTIGRIFRKVWVPGQPQVKYARKLGFASNRIATGFYSCDVNHFHNLYLENQKSKAAGFPRRLLCVARYIPVKGYAQLWSAFITWKSRYNNDWELWCAGTGEDFDKREIHPSIRHLGFIQKDELERIIKDTGVFILASNSEPWGVAVHEYSAAGYPLVLSNHVGAASAFVNESNGFLFNPDSEDEIINALQKLSELSDEQLIRMSEASSHLAFSITPEKWASTVWQL